MQYLLAILFLLSPSLSLAAEPHSVCSVEDFGDFIKQFGALAREEQSTCLKFPVKVDGKSYKNLAALDNSRYQSRKFVAGPVAGPSDLKYVEKKEIANPCYVDDKAKLPPGKYGYFYETNKSGKGVELMLTAGGELSFYESVSFKFNKGEWQLTAIVEGD